MYTFLLVMAFSALFLILFSVIGCLVSWDRRGKMTSFWIICALAGCVMFVIAIIGFQLRASSLEVYTIQDGCYSSETTFYSFKVYKGEKVAEVWVTSLMDPDSSEESLSRWWSIHAVGNVEAGEFSPRTVEINGAATEWSLLMPNEHFFNGGIYINIPSVFKSAVADAVKSVTATVESATQ